MSENASFSAKKLYEQTTGAQFESESVQSVWAYSVKYKEKISTGRIRMTMQKVSAAEMIEALGGSLSAEDQSKISGYSISAYLEKWTSDKGWLHVLDWMGNPSASFVEIEQSLYEMYKSFVTGTVADLPNSMSFPDFDPFPPPRDPAVKKTPTPTKKKNTPEPKDSDFDWI